MKRVIVAHLTAILLMASAVCLAGYADDRAEIENLSNRYMVAVDAGDIETVMGTWADEECWYGWVGPKMARRRSARPCRTSGAPSR